MTLSGHLKTGHDGGTNGKQIGEVARKACTGDWIITPEQVSKDYQ